MDMRLIWSVCEKCGFRWFSVPADGCPVCTYKPPKPKAYSWEGRI
jgi:ribosomal protein L37E